ncbi:MAG: hypothetical protein LBN95_03525 [Prevotellaceae bacterium]|jgi:hypothetical protein|nr:hypothetical protein [Prevotellaceae bacterium]
MKLIRPKIIGTLKIQKMMAGNLAVINDIKSSPNKIIIPCESVIEGEEIIEKIKTAKPNEMLYFSHFKNK